MSLSAPWMRVSVSVEMLFALACHQWFVLPFLLLAGSPRDDRCRELHGRYTRRLGEVLNPLLGCPCICHGGIGRRPASVGKLGTVACRNYPCGYAHLPGASRRRTRRGLGFCRLDSAQVKELGDSEDSFSYAVRIMKPVGYVTRSSAAEGLPMSYSPTIDGRVSSH